MPAKFVPPGPAQLLQQCKLWLRQQPPMAWASYACALLGARFAIHDFHHYDPDRFGLSTPLLTAAVLLYVWGQRRPGQKPPAVRPRR